MNTYRSLKNQHVHFGDSIENNSLNIWNKHKCQFFYISSRGSWETKESFVIKGNLNHITEISEITFELNNTYCDSRFDNHNIMKVTKERDNFQRDSKTHDERQSVNQSSSSERKSPQKKRVECFKLKEGRQSGINYSDEVASNKNATKFKFWDCSPEFDPSQDIFGPSPIIQFNCSQKISIDNNEQEFPLSCIKENSFKYDIEKEIPVSRIRKLEDPETKVIHDEKEITKNKLSKCIGNVRPNFNGKSSPPSKKRHKLDDIVSQNFSLLEEISFSGAEDEKREQCKRESEREGTFCTKNKSSSPIKFQITSISNCTDRVSPNISSSNSMKQEIKLGGVVGVFNVEDSKSDKIKPTLMRNFSQDVKGGIWTETPQKETNNVTMKSSKGKTEMKDLVQDSNSCKTKLKSPLAKDISLNVSKICRKETNKGMQVGVGKSFTEISIPVTEMKLDHNCKNRKKLKHSKSKSNVSKIILGEEKCKINNFVDFDEQLPLGGQKMSGDDVNTLKFNTSTEADRNINSNETREEYNKNESVDYTLLSAVESQLRVEVNREPTVQQVDLVQSQDHFIVEKKQKLQREDITKRNMVSVCKQLDIDDQCIITKSNDSKKTLEHKESKANTMANNGEKSSPKETQEILVDDTDVINMVSNTEIDKSDEDKEDFNIDESRDSTLITEVQSHPCQETNESCPIEKSLKQVHVLTTTLYDQDQSREQMEDENSYYANQSLTLGRRKLNEECSKETSNKQTTNVGCKSLFKKSINSHVTGMEVKEKVVPRKRRKFSKTNSGWRESDEMQLSESKKPKTNELYNESELQNVTIIDSTASEKTVKSSNANSITSMIIETGELSVNEKTHVDTNIINISSDSVKGGDISDIDREEYNENVFEDLTVLPDFQSQPDQIAHMKNVVEKTDEVFSTNKSVELEQIQSGIHVVHSCNTPIENENDNEIILEDQRNETLKSAMLDLIGDSTSIEYPQENIARMGEIVCLPQNRRTSVEQVINVGDINNKAMTDSKNIKKSTQDKLINFTEEGAEGQPALGEIEEMLVHDAELRNTQSESENCGNDNEKRREEGILKSGSQSQFSDPLCQTIWKRILKLFMYVSPENPYSKHAKKKKISLRKNRNSESTVSTSVNGLDNSVLENHSEFCPTPCNDSQPNLNTSPVKRRLELQNSNSSGSIVLGELELLSSSGDEDCTISQNDNNMSSENILPLGSFGDENRCSNKQNGDLIDFVIQTETMSRTSNTSVQSLKKDLNKKKLKEDTKSSKKQKRSNVDVINEYSRKNSKSFPDCSLPGELENSDAKDPEWKPSGSDSTSCSMNENHCSKKKFHSKTSRPAFKSDLNSPCKNRITFVSSTPFTERSNEFQNFYDENLDFGSDNINESQNDNHLSSMSSFSNETILEEIQCKIIKSETELKSLKQLSIKIDWKLSPLHKIDTGSCKVNMKMLKEKLGPEHSKYLNEGKFTEEDENKIKQSWEEFMKVYKFTSPEVFFPTAQNFGHFSLKERRNFKLFLAKYLPERRLISVYLKFINIYGVKKKGRWLEKEDRLLLDIYNTIKRRNSLNFREGNETENEDKLGLPMKKIMSRALDRTVTSVDSRLKILLENEKHTSLSQEGISWTPELEGALIHRLIKTLKFDTLEDLRHTKISYRVWRKVVSKMELPIDQVLNQWKYHLYPQLFAQQPVLRHILQIELIKWLYRSNIKDYKLIDWNDMSKRAGDLGSCYLYRIFRTLIGNLVPVELRNNFRETIGFLYDHYLPKLKEKTSSHQMIRKVYDPATRTLQFREEDEVDCLPYRIE